MKFVFLTALKTEAKALIKEYDLKESKNNSFFNNNNFSLFITGMGKEQTLKNISHFLSFYKDLDETIAINIGVAGGNPKTTSLEDCYLINKIKNETNKDVFYPDVLIEHNWEERSLITAKKAIEVPSTNYPNIVDMEASHIYASLIKHLPSHRLVFLKIISDHMDIQDWKKIDVDHLITKNIPAIKKWLNKEEWKFLKQRRILSNDETNLLIKYFKKIRLTVSQQHQLIEILENYKKRNNALPVLSKHFKYVPKFKDDRDKIFQGLKMNFLPDFSHIYVESQSIDSDIAEQSFKRFPKAKIIEIEDYKKIFNKNGQDFQIQKLSTKLILAKKQPPFIYPATDIIQDSGFSNFYYCTPILNCIYNCEYCFLQGMYSSANIVVFTNTEEVKDAVKKQILERNYPDEPLLLSLSYNTDILALENILPLTKQWIDFANNTDDLFMEIRTKSGLTSSFNKLKPSKKILFAWTLSPNNIIQKYEHKTPLLERRIMSIQKIVDSGWPVRLSFDPILIYPNWKEDYKQMFERIKETISGDKIFDITIGVFRMSEDFFNRIKKTKPNSDLFYNNYDNSNNVKTVTKDQKAMVRDFALSQLDGYCSRDKINFWD